MSYASLDPRRVIGLFLAKLFEYLVGLQNSGHKVGPKDIAIMVRSADAMVNSVIRSLAVRQLKDAGYTYAAQALRDRQALRDARRSAQAMGGADSLVCSCSRAPSVRIERAQGCSHVTPAELIDRLKTTIENFERADELADQLARIVLCALAFVFPETREALVFARPGNDLCRVGLGPQTIIPVGRGPPYLLCRQTGPPRSQNETPFRCRAAMHREPDRGNPASKIYESLAGLPPEQVRCSSPPYQATSHLRPRDRSAALKAHP